MNIWDRIATAGGYLALGAVYVVCGLFIAALVWGFLTGDVGGFNLYDEEPLP
jgi:hypothetical protein